MGALARLFAWVDKRGHATITGMNDAHAEWGPSSTGMTAAALAEIDLFRELSEASLADLAPRLRVGTRGPGEVIFREGEPATEMYVLLAGELEVVKASRSGRETRVAILGPGDVFGEMAILDHEARSATVRSLSPVRLLRLSANDTDELAVRDIHAYATVLRTVARNVSRRLRVTDSLLATITANVLDEYVVRRSEQK